ncbi:MAG: amidohydrolase family protein, partial [Clostridia bacterium]
AMERVRSDAVLRSWGPEYGLRLQVFWIDSDGRQASPDGVREDEPGWFRTLGVKLFSDGALGTRTAWMKEPYEDGAGTGVPRLHGPELRERLRQLAGYRWAAAIHAIGDAAVGDVWEALLEVPARGAALSRIEHAQLVDPADLVRLSGQGLAASMQPFHLPGDVPALQRGLGGRGTLAFAWRALRDAGFVVTFGSDAPIVPADPMPALEVAVRGVDYRGDDERALSPYEAIMAYSRAAARADRRPGGLVAAGHPADLTVFAENPLQTLAEGGRPVVQGTLVAGQVRYWRER